MTDYSPNVSFSVPVFQRPTIKVEEKPDINVQPIDISGFANALVKGFEKKQEAEVAQQKEALLSKYASKYDSIQIALEQGEISVTDADIAKRQVSEEFRMAGGTVKDDLQLRGGYGANIEQFAKTRQEMIVREEEQVRQDRRKEIRDMFPSLKNADNNTIDSLDNYSKMFSKTQEDLQAIINNPYTSQAEREGAMMQLTNSVETEAYMNAQAIADNYMEMVETTGQIDASFRQSFIEDTAQQMISRGLPPAAARLTAENLWKTTGLADYHSLSKVDREAATKEYQSRSANYEAALKSQGIEGIYKKVQQNPIMSEILALPEQSQRAMPVYMWEDFNNNFVTYKGNVKGDQVDQKKLRFADAGSVVNAVQYHNIVLKSGTTSTKNKNAVTGTTAAGVAGTYADVDVKTADKDTLATTSKNIAEVRKRIDTPAARREIEKGLQSKDPESVTIAEKAKQDLDGLKTTEDALNFMYNIEGPAKDLLAENANRIRTDAQGNIVLTGNRTFWQAVTDPFNDLEYTVNSINKGASMLSPDERKKMFEYIGVKSLQAGETATDLSGLNVAKVATGLVQGAEKLINRDPAVREALGALVRDTSSIQAARNRMFTGEETTTTTKVSNTSTLGGASIVPDGMESVKAIREYADRLQASVDRVKAEGAKTEPGKLERDLKAIADARKYADNLEKTLIDERADGGSPRVSLERSEEISKKLELLEAKQKYLRENQKDDTVEYQMISDVIFNLYKELGEVSE